jgi:hypothetical protein
MDAYHKISDGMSLDIFHIEGIKNTSLDRKVACRFGYRVIKAYVPISEILFSPIIWDSFDGNSLAGESEYAVMGASDIECGVLSSPFIRAKPIIPKWKFPQKSKV